MRLPSSLATSREATYRRRETWFSAMTGIAGEVGASSAVCMASLSRDSQRRHYGNHDRDGGDAARMTLPRRRSGFRLRTGPCQALGADTPRDAELRGDLACRRLGSERKYVKRIYARDTGKAGSQFAR